jgi:hypothetical protein
MGDSRRGAEGGDVIPLATLGDSRRTICSYTDQRLRRPYQGREPDSEDELPGPQADVLVLQHVPCRDVKDWFQFYARSGTCPAWASTRRLVRRIDEPMIVYVGADPRAG